MWPAVSVTAGFALAEKTPLSDVVNFTSIVVSLGLAPFVAYKVSQADWAVLFTAVLINSDRWSG